MILGGCVVYGNAGVNMVIKRVLKTQSEAYLRAKSERKMMLNCRAHAFDLWKQVSESDGILVTN
jgi:hypothetical protein